MASSLPPVKNAAFTFPMSLVSQADTDIFKTSVTLAAGDVKVSLDFGAFNNVSTLPTEIGTSGVLSCPLSAAEMNADVVTVKFTDAAGSEWQDALVTIYTAAQTMDTTDGVVDGISAVKPAYAPTVAATGEASANVTYWKGVAVPTPTYAGYPDVGEVVGSVEGNVQGSTASVAGNVGGSVNSLASTARLQVTNALAVAPTVGIADGSAYDKLNEIIGAVQPEHLDWSAWTTPDGALADLYDDNAVDELTHSGTTLAAESDTGFAAWVMQEFDDKLFVGVGKTPANHIAAVIGSLATAGATPTFEYALPEEGVAAMRVGPDGKFYVAGADERANTGDSSIYVRTAEGTWTRKQTISNTQHIWGLCFVGSRLWVAGQGNPDGVLYSNDYGDTWQLGGLGPSQRYYDVIGLGSAVIVTAWDPLPWWPIYRTLDSGVNWNQVTGIESGTGRMVEWEGVIVGVSNTGKLFTVNSGGTGTEYTPPFTPAQTYNNLAVDTDGYLCALGTTGVWRTADLVNWKQIWSFSPADTVRALGTWGGDLVVSTDGATAQVLARPASPEAAEQQQMRDAMQLAPSTSTAAAGSVDADLADILTDTAAIKLITDAIDVSAVTQAPANNAGTLAFTVGVTFDETPTGMVIPVDWSECYFTLKGDKASEADSQALIQIKVTNGGDAGDGLQRLDKSALVAPVASADASLVVNQAAGTVRIIVSDDALALLTGGRSGLEWDLKVHRSTGASKVLTTGDASIEWTPTRAV